MTQKNLPLLKLLDDLKSSYWFVPALMTALAAVLAVAVINIDLRLGSNWVARTGFLYASEPDGARDMLSTIAGSMITVAGVVFSITTASVAYTAGQYGPRLLTNYMRDRGNQVTLGTFIATFIYCLVVLRTVRSSEEYAGEGAMAAQSFVPQLAVLGGIGLAVASIAVLIYFVHHVPLSIHVNELVASIGRQLIGSVDKTYPQFIGRDAEGEPPRDRLRHAISVRADRTGYVQAIDAEELFALACRHDLVLELHYQPGDHVHTGRALMSVGPPGRVDDALGAKLLKTYAVGNKRTAFQDTLFLVDELVEVGARALSPGVNDPFTAIACLDWLGAATADLARRRIPRAERADDEGRVRVIAKPIDFEDFLHRGFATIRPYAARDANASRHMLSVLAEVATGCDNPGRTRLLREEAAALLALCEEGLTGPSLEAVRERHAALERALADPGHKEERLREAELLGGPEI